MNCGKLSNGAILDFCRMDSVWLNVDDSYSSCDYDSGSDRSFGVFTADPSVIGQSLPRPAAPFDASFDYFDSGMDEEDKVYQCRVLAESPPMSRPFGFERSNPFISVFD